jgi:Asp/Glu/hydantoin racemase
MNDSKPSPRFLLINPFRLPAGSRFIHRPVEGPKEIQLVNYGDVEHVLADVDWDLHPGPLTRHGDWSATNREEFAYVAADRLQIVRDACASGKYDAIVLLGGAEPGFQDAREIGKSFGIPVTGCAFSQMHIASMLGDRFSVIDLYEAHAKYFANIVVQHRFAERCASIRNIEYPLPRPGVEDRFPVGLQREKALAGEPSEMLETCVREAVAAIEDDGAEVLIFGCSATYWLRPFLQRRLNELGWDVPVLEGQSAAIQLAKLLVGLALNASGLTFPSSRPVKTRRRILP